MFVSHFVYSYFLFALVNAVSIPPTIVIEPASDLIVDPTLPVELPCLATGNPTPIYTWLKDGHFYSTMSSEMGTLTFAEPTHDDQGYYQCNATNSLGTAVSRRVRLRLAELASFPVYETPQMIQVGRGDSLKIPCRPPAGVPDPDTYWTDRSQPGNQQYGYRVSNARMQQDDSGNLYFLNVKDEDEQKQLVCNVFSRQLNIIRRGIWTQLKVIPAEPVDRQPIRLWTPENEQIFLKGGNLTLKCIFGGLPTPEVIWRKLDGSLPERRLIIDGRKQELIITDAQYEDSGVYQCRGENELGYDTFDIHVQIDAAPVWKVQPKDLHIGEGESVELICEAEASRPSVQLQWSINGIPFARTSRRRLSKNRLILSNINKNDTAVYQCNISNTHGYLFSNFFVNVMSEKATIQRGPEPNVRVVEGQNVHLPCETSGAPKPKVSWSKRNQILSTGRFAISDDGSLSIRDVSMADSGVYVCNVSNKFGMDVRNGTLNVTRKTQIQMRTNNQEVRRGASALFRCTATTDPSVKPEVNWYKDKQLLAYTGRFIKDSSDQHTLKIVDVQFDDAGTYACRASTELDFDEASAALVVQDRPNRPTISKIICNGSVRSTKRQPFAIVQWTPAGDNNARILYYELQYNTSFQPTSWISIPIEQRRESFTEVKSADGSIKLEPKTTIFKTTHLPSNQNDLHVPLSCWGNYTFRLIAYNRIGASELSLVSRPMCSTEQCRPKSNPTGVRASTTQTSPLIIEWDSMPSIKWGAPKFWYEVSWRAFATKSNAGPFLTQRVNPPLHQFAIPNPVMHLQYQYYVKAVNQLTGETNSTDALETPVYYVAFAGDAAPTYVPRNFRVLRMLDSTTVQFGWEAPQPTDEINIRGVLKGYQIEVFRLDDPENSRRVVSDIGPNQTWTTVFNAPPNADVGAHICIETERYFGPSSAVIQFPTREGRPSPVTNLRAVPYTSDGIFLLWDPPEEANGIIIGYQIDYNTLENLASQSGSDQPSILLRDDTRRSYLLGGLQPNRKYRVQVRAQTSVGLSTRPAMVELMTNRTLVPSKPSFTINHRGSTFINISFDPTIMTVPGSLYYVQYKENDNNEATLEKKTYAVSNERTILIGALEPGQTYVTRLVAADGILSETFSDPQMINTLAKDRAPRVINSPWFIGLIVSLIVLIIVVAIVCGILKRKGGKYSANNLDRQTVPYDILHQRIQDKEMLHGPGLADEDAKFSEYFRPPSDTSIKRSRTSLNNGDDRDSMAEFNDEKDRGRFTEDGSFIGQYGRDDPRRSYLIKHDDTDGLTSTYHPAKSFSNV